MKSFLRVLQVVLPALMLCAALVGVVSQKAFAASHTALADHPSANFSKNQISCPQTIAYGSTGQLVENLQTRLNQRGANLAVDGIFGSLTLSAVKQFQASQGLAVDGIVGMQTWNALGACEAIASKQ